MCILIGISIWFGKTTASKEYYHQKNLDYLETKRDNAKALSGAASAASVAISLFPEDMGTPIANQIANIGAQFLIILSALTAEQKLLMLTGEISFCWLFPFAIASLILFAILQRKLFLQIGVKLAIGALSIYLVVPLTIQITRMADTSYQETVDKTLEQSKALEDAIQYGISTPSQGSTELSEDRVDGTGSYSDSTTKDLSAGITEDSLIGAAAVLDKASKESLNDDTKDQVISTEVNTEALTENITEKETAKETSKETEKKKKQAWYKNAWDTVTDAADTVGDTANEAFSGVAEFVKGTADKLDHAADSAISFAQNTAHNVTGMAATVADRITNATDSTVSFFQNIPNLPNQAAELLDSFTESFVIMMVTTCVLPILVLLGSLWLMNMILSIDPDWDGAKLYRSGRKKHSND